MKPYFVLVGLWLSGVALAANDNALKVCPDFPAPKKAVLQTVSSQMSFNDIPMAIRRFDSPEPPEAMLAFYRDLWAATAKTPGPVEYPLGQWKVIASQRGDCFFTVQVMSDGKNGATGFLGMTAPPSERPVVKAELPMMTGSNVVNDLAHSDAGKVARTVLLTNKFSPETNADFYRNAYTGKGWQVVTHHRFDKPGSRGDVLVMKDGLREVSITTMRQNEDTQVLLNFVDTP
jgi:hypothetical protein